tara:strand:- start:20188 stop:21669 length:1482 start_codon:yes stop_codon:yes gene_type:complete
MSQKILSTKENYEQQKRSIFYSSSAVFWGVIDRDKGLDTSVSLLNHFLLKRDIKSVALRLSVRDLLGKLVTEKNIEISEPKVYIFSLSKILSNNYSKGEFSIYAEFSSNENLAIPFCATMGIISSPNTIDHIHAYGRGIEVTEINSNIDFRESAETGWSVSPGKNTCNFAILHNGRLFSTVGGELEIYQGLNKIHNCNLKKIDLAPFATLKINLEEYLISSEKGKKLLTNIQKSNYGDYDCKVKLTGLKATFPRLLFISTANIESKEKPSSVNFDYLDMTHSNFDFDNVEQPKSKLDVGYINNPSYPDDIIHSGFRYYPAKELNNLTIKGNRVNTNIINLPKHSFLKVSSPSVIPSRIVGGNWVKWKKSPLVGECSTGTFIVEYNEKKSFWHWGMLTPDASIYESRISLINPFCSSSKKNLYKLKIYGTNGLIHQEDFQITGSLYKFIFKPNEITTENIPLWYVINGEGIGGYNVFTTLSFSDGRDGSVEHSF